MLYVGTLRLRISNYYVRRLLRIPKGFNADFYNWSADNNECTATFWCNDSYADPALRKTKEDLNQMIVSKFGNNIISEYLPTPKAFDPRNQRLGTPLKNPLLKINQQQKSDNYKEYYDLELTKPQLQEINRSLMHLAYKQGGQYKQLRESENRIRPDRIKGDTNIVRVGTW